MALGLHISEGLKHPGNQFSKTGSVWVAKTTSLFLMRRYQRTECFDKLMTAFFGIWNRRYFIKPDLDARFNDCIDRKGGNPASGYLGLQKDKEKLMQIEL